MYHRSQFPYSGQYLFCSSIVKKILLTLIQMYNNIHQEYKLIAIHYKVVFIQNFKYGYNTSSQNLHTKLVDFNIHNNFIKKNCLVQ